jgi:hypothetical protein
MKDLLLLACGIMIGLLLAPHFQRAAKPNSPIGAFLHRYLQPEEENREGGRIDPATGRFVLYRDQPTLTGEKEIKIEERSGPVFNEPAPTADPTIREKWGWKPRGTLDQPAAR